MNKILERLKSKYPNGIRQGGKGDRIFYEDSICQNVYFVLSGALEIISVSFEGKEMLIKKLAEGDIFGNNLIFSADGRFRGDVISASPCSLLSLSKKEFLEELSSDRELLEYYLSYQAKDTLNLNKRIKILSLNKAEERLSFYINTNKGKLEFDSVTSLSKELGLSREATSRLLSRTNKKSPRD